MYNIARKSTSTHTEESCRLQRSHQLRMLGVCNALASGRGLIRRRRTVWRKREKAVMEMSRTASTYGYYRWWGKRLCQWMTGDFGVCGKRAQICERRLRSTKFKVYDGETQLLEAPTERYEAYEEVQYSSVAVTGNDRKRCVTNDCYVYCVQVKLQQTKKSFVLVVK